MLTLFADEKDKHSQRARAFLDKAGVSYTLRDVTRQHPNADELQHYIDISGHSAFSFLRTNGYFGAFAMLERMGMIRDEYRAAFLAASGKLIRRPLLVGDSFVLFGFWENEWLKNLKKIRMEQGTAPFDAEISDDKNECDASS